MKKLFVTALLLTTATPALAQQGPTPAPFEEEAASEIGGLRVEAHVGIERPNLNESDAQFEYIVSMSSSLAYGGEIGYDIPVSNGATVGPYVSYDMASSEKCDTGRDVISGLAYDYDVCTKSKSNLSIGIRGGLHKGNGELYMGVGYDIYDIDYTENYTPVTAGTPFVYEDTEARKGIGFMMGYNHNLNKTVYLGGGVKISSFGNFLGTDWDLQRVQGHVALGARF